MPHSNNKQFPTITFYSSHLHHLTTTSHLGRWHDDEAVSKDGAPSAHSAPSLCLQDWKFTQIAHHGYDDPEQNISRLLKHQFSLALLSSVSHQELASSISTDLRVLSQQRSSKAPHPTITLQQFAQWKATLLHKKLGCGSKHSGSYISTEECANGNAPEEFKILGQSRRPSPLSSLRPRKQKLTHVLNVASILFIGISNFYGR